MGVNAMALPRSRWWRRLSVIELYLWAFRLAVVLVVVWGVVGTVRAARYSGEVWLDFVVFGFSQGAIYALIALGYTMVYGILRMINFAHGDIFMVGAYTAYYAARALDQRGIFNSRPLLSLALILVVAMVVSMVTALLVERVAYRPLRRAPRLVPLISAIGASFFLEYAVRGLYGSGFQAYPEFNVFKGEWVLFGVGILRTQAVVIVSALILMAALYLFVMRTKTGTAMRSVAEDMEVAALMGINVDRIIVITFAIGGAAAGAAGILYALVFKQVHFFMGFYPGIKAFTAAVLGGIGNIPGALLGGVALGLIESVAPILVLDGLGIVAPYQLKDVTAFIMLVMVLIFRPSGILGERLATKKA
ncbi:MAG: branched-chain amino acid ABC transporter permease [Armatimonadota bacterium]|nr:branched-chain amino acid ABC transporter permease [Armatimonadota bacterium]MDR7452394.1 branched-chain amino acid ABC transporter permease [Armatimonadota bacterium]MDR7466739.1 branched-chain amino acid ABC transporter permease [Armatimonadota bacterium]MDR7492787.1 branched-chain amino acid ABC transporter permease [Armatimonadota bacterium]MDR7498563.1 branched-chain amino acid ABC transporter permease [Armatimonadota bacterium]